MRPRCRSRHPSRPRRGGRPATGAAVAGIGRVAVLASCARWCRCSWRSSPGGLLLARARRRTRSTFYANIWSGGVELPAWQDSAMRMAPLLLIAAGLIVVFRANIWNLGYDGQFLLGAALIAGLGPAAAETHAAWLASWSCSWSPRWSARPGRSSRRCSRPTTAERDHHDADDVLHRRRPGEHPDQGAVPGPALDTSADARRSVRQDAARRSRVRASTSAS